MRLTRLQIDALPGLATPLRIERLGPGVNVVLGPNASGKSSLIRALLAILYPAQHADLLVDGQVELTTSSGATLIGRRLGDAVSWERSGRPAAAPELPEPHLVGTYVLRLEDLLSQLDEGARGRRRPVGSRTSPERLDEHIAQRLDQELTGGIDLMAVRKGLGEQAEKGQKLAGSLRDATQAHNDLRRRRAELQREVDRLAEAREELTAASTEVAGGRLVDDAESLLNATKRVAALQADLGSYPPQLGALSGNEAEEFAKAATAAAQLRRDLAELEGLLASANEDLAGGGELPSKPDAELHLQLSEMFVRVAEQRAVQERELAGMGARYQEALRRLGGAPARAAQANSATPAASGGSGAVAKPDIGHGTLERLERLLEEYQRARVELHEKRRQLNEISRLIVPSDDDDSILDVPAGIYRGGRTMDGLDSPLRVVRRDLIRWLQEPLREPRRPDWAWAVALGLSATTVLMAGLSAPDGLLYGSAAVTIGWLAALRLLLRPPRSPLKQRLEDDVKALQDATDIALPEQWSHAGIVNVILDIDDEIARRDNAREEAERYDRQLQQLTDESRAAQQRVRALQAELEAMRQEVGYAYSADIGLTLWLQAAREVETVTGVLAGARTELHQLVSHHGELERRLSAYLDIFDGAGASAVVVRGRFDPSAVRTRCRELLRRVERHAVALAERERALRELRRAQSDLAARNAQLQELATRAALQPPTPDELPQVQRRLGELLERLPAWRTVRERLQAERALVAELTARLEGNALLLEAALAGDHGAITATRLATQEAAERQQELSRFVHRTERDVEHASSQRQLQRAAAEVRTASDALEAHRGEALDLAAAAFMLDIVESEHQAGALPAALVRASGWFSKFTDGAFELTFDQQARAGSGRRLGAVDAASGRNLELTELSSGTRAQLLLASRLAFALETETTGHGLPFFLDEALTTSDEGRFKQVARAVLQVARDEDRQFIYLSARADDAELWREAAASQGTTVELIESLSTPTTPEARAAD